MIKLKTNLDLRSEAKLAIQFLCSKFDINPSGERLAKKSKFTSGIKWEWNRHHGYENNHNVVLTVSYYAESANVLVDIVYREDYNEFDNSTEVTYKTVKRRSGLEAAKECYKSILNQTPHLYK